MASAIQIGSVIDSKYRVVRHIGEGGMGSVYEGENTRIERRVAIKVLHEHVASSPEFAQRFEREARASARIGSPHVCDVLDLGDLPNGDRYIVMEYLEGESLEDRIARGKMTADELAPIAFEILEGLGTMHHAGVIHRDLKPANVFLVRRPSGRETVKILDFGVAKILPKADDPAQMTATGMMMGTPLYMSPEQARGARDVDGRTDLYAASVIFYRALTGVMPHSGLNLHELLFKIVLEDPKPITDFSPDVDPAFAAIIGTGLSRDADARFASARAYQEALAAWGETIAKPPISFSVTLPNEPPKLRNVTGPLTPGQLKQLTPLTGPGTPLPVIGNSNNTPVMLTPQEHARAAAPTVQSGGHKAAAPAGTPTAWADDAPAIAKRALAELDAKNTKVSYFGGTKLMPPVPERLTSAPPETSASTPPSRKTIGVGIAVGAVFLVAAAFFGVRVVGGHSTATPDPTSALAHPPSAAPSAEPPPPPTVATTIEPPTPPMTTTTTTVAEPVPTVPTPATTSHFSAPHPPPIAGSSAKTAPSASVAPPPTPSASASAGHRKFRQTIE